MRDVPQFPMPLPPQDGPVFMQSQLTQLVAALQDATGSVVSTNGKCSNRRQPGSAPAAKKPRARRNQPATPPVLLNPMAPPNDTVTGPGLQSTSGEPAALRTPQPLQHFESVTRQIHDDGDSSTNASDVWYNLYYLGDSVEPAERPDHQPCRCTNPCGDKKCTVKYS